jgi:hypothetical protein
VLRAPVILRIATLEIRIERTIHLTGCGTNGVARHCADSKKLFPQQHGKLPAMLNVAFLVALQLRVHRVPPRLISGRRISQRLPLRHHDLAADLHVHAINAATFPPWKRIEAVDHVPFRPACESGCKAACVLCDEPPINLRIVRVRHWVVGRHGVKFDVALRDADRHLQLDDGPFCAWLIGKYDVSALGALVDLRLGGSSCDGAYRCQQDLPYEKAPVSPIRSTSGSILIDLRELVTLNIGSLRRRKIALNHWEFEAQSD